MEAPKNLLVLSDKTLSSEDSREFLLRVSRAYPGTQISTYRPSHYREYLADVLQERGDFPPAWVRAFRFGVAGTLYLYGHTLTGIPGDTCMGFHEAMADLSRFGSGGSYNER